MQEILSMDNPTGIPLLDTIGIEILMHRDIHFGGNFDIMIEYYEQNGIGMMPDFSLKQIVYLQNFEKKEGKNLVDVYLPEPEKELIAKSKELYLEFRNAYETKKKDDPMLLISDLLFSEDENPQSEIQALIDHGKEVFPALINLISSPSFYNPLYPGYGRAPIFAAKCLSCIADERAIPPLFEAIGQKNFFTDEALISAICSFGETAKDFLFKVLRNKPFSKDNENAAITLNSFGNDPGIATVCLAMLIDPDSFKHQVFSTYLIFSCGNLTGSEERQTFINLSKTKNLHPVLKDEMRIVSNTWEKLTFSTA